LIQSEENPEFVAVCAGNDCRMALRKEEIAAEILGTFVDYFERIPAADIRITYCYECWEKLKEGQTSNMRTAIARRRAFESLDKEDKKDKQEE
jgi:predicted Rdx family selenoprotein